MAWDTTFLNPNIDVITMTYSYMRHYEDRVRRAGQHARPAPISTLWRGGMKPNIPVGPETGVSAGTLQAEREQQPGGQWEWVAHWKMDFKRPGRPTPL